MRNHEENSNNISYVLSRCAKKTQQMPQKNLNLVVNFLLSFPPIVTFVHATHIQFLPERFIIYNLI